MKVSHCWLRNSRALPRRGRPRGPGGSFRHGLCRYRAAKNIAKPTAVPNASTGCCREIAMTSEGDIFLRAIDIPERHATAIQCSNCQCKPQLLYCIIPMSDHERFDPPNFAWIGAFLPRLRIMVSFHAVKVGSYPSRAETRRPC